MTFKALPSLWLGPSLDSAGYDMLRTERNVLLLRLYDNLERVYRYQRH